jgi:glycosyltransferase involved in cell wall biosynthesis
MTTLIIQIPCYNESMQLPATMGALPRTLPGVARIEWLVVDDGSVDGTESVARRCGADHVLRLPQNKGLATAFSAGLEAALRAGADIVVNTDADNQYCADDIAALIAPILAGRAEIVIGARPIGEIAHFSAGKRWLQALGSRVVCVMSGLEVPDATSGFRAFTREAALTVNVFSRYTYTLETLIQAGQRRIAVASVPVRVNPPTRPSRLMRSTAGYVFRATLSIVRTFIVYRPLRFLAFPATACIGAGGLLGLRFLYYYFQSGGAAGHVQSLIFASILIVVGAIFATAGVLADLIAINRRLLEDLQTRERRRDWRDGQ